MSNAEQNTNMVNQPDSESRSPATAADDKAQRDPRNRNSTQRENRRKLGVEEDHKTADMKKKHRGTFP